MSAVPRTVPTRPLPRPAARPRPALRVVPASRRVAGRLPFLAVVAALLVTGLLSLLALNTVLAQDAFALHELRVEQKRLDDREQALLTRVQDLEAPAAFAERARELGLVDGGAPGFLRLSDGAILGDPQPAAAPTAAPTVETESQ